MLNVTRRWKTARDDHSLSAVNLRALLPVCEHHEKSKRCAVQVAHTPNRIRATFRRAARAERASAVTWLLSPASSRCSADSEAFSKTCRRRHLVSVVHVHKAQLRERCRLVAEPTYRLCCRVARSAARLFHRLMVAAAAAVLEVRETCADLCAASLAARAFVAHNCSPQCSLRRRARPSASRTRHNHAHWQSARATLVCIA